MKRNEFIKSIAAGMATIALLPSIIISGAKKRFAPRPLGKPEDTFKTLMARIEWRDIKKAGRHPICDLPTEALVMNCFFVVESDWKSRGKSTIRIQDGGSKQMVLAKKQLTAGSVIRYSPNPPAFSNHPRTLDIVTGGAPWVAGVGVLIVEYAMYPK